MKKSTLFIVSIILSVFSVHSQMDSYNILSDLKTKVQDFRGDVFYIEGKVFNSEEKFGEFVKKDIEYIYQYQFNKNKDLMQYFKEDDYTVNIEKYNYNKNNQLISYIIYELDKTTNTKEEKEYVCKYNENNKLIEIISLSDSTRLVYDYQNGKNINIDKYNKEGNLINRIQRKYSSNIEFEDILYDSDGELSQKTYYKNGLKIGVEKGRVTRVYKYNANKKIIEEIATERAPGSAKAIYNGKDIGNSYSFKLNYVYNDKGDFTTLKSSVQGQNIATAKVEYTYDNKKNWSKSIHSIKTYDSSEPEITLEERAIVYYSTAKSDSLPQVIRLDECRDYSTDLPDSNISYNGGRYSTPKTSIIYFYEFLKEQKVWGLPYDKVVVVDLIVHKSGAPRNIEIKQGYNNDFNERLINAIKKAKFIPAVKNGKFVSAKIRLPITLDFIHEPKYIDFSTIKGLESLK